MIGASICVVVEICHKHVHECMALLKRYYKGKCMNIGDPRFLTAVKCEPKYQPSPLMDCVKAIAAFKMSIVDHSSI